MRDLLVRLCGSSPSTVPEALRKLKSSGLACGSTVRHSWAVRRRSPGRKASVQLVMVSGYIAAVARGASLSPLQINYYENPNRQFRRRFSFIQCLYFVGCEIQILNTSGNDLTLISLLYTVGKFRCLPRT